MRTPSPLLLAALVAALPLWAQRNPPHLAYVFPAGGQQGATVLVKLGGQYLLDITAVYISGPGIRAQALDYARPMNLMQARQLRERMDELRKKPRDPSVQKEMAEIRTKLVRFAMDRNTSPVLAETVTLEITIAPDAGPGHHELRVATPMGISNPIVFCVGQLPEVVEKESLNINAAPDGGANVEISRPATDMSITLPAVVNGRIKPGPGRGRPVRSPQAFTPGDADRYRFQARQGQQLVIATSARELIPYLADAVPGWFQAVVTLLGSDGKELLCEDNYRFRPDPVLHYVIPKDGEYVVEIRDALYRGREDFVYRIAIGELPFITGTFPLGGKTGAKTKLEVAGWNLPQAKLTVNAKSKPAGVYPIVERQGKLVSNSAPFMVDTLREMTEKEPNNDPRAAQKVKLPVTINGRIERPGDWDVFQFNGRAGEKIVAEVYARRLDSPLDSVLRLTDARGKQLAFNDDNEDKGSGLETHHADSFILTTLPANGTYYLHIGDTQQKGGREYAYRLRISAPRPGFELRVTPSSISANGGITVPVAVYALRKDGFSGGIALSLQDAPKGYALSGALLPAGQDKVRLTMTVPPVPQLEPLSLKLEGRAVVDGREVTRVAVPAEDMMQAFAYRHLVPAQDLKVLIRKGASFRAPIRVLSEPPLRIPAGQTVRLRVRVPIPPTSPLGKLQYELSEPPEGVEIQETVATRDVTEIVLKCDAAKAKPGQRGNLIINLSAERTPPPTSGQPASRTLHIPLGALPAVPFEIQ